METGLKTKEREIAIGKRFFIKLSGMAPILMSGLLLLALLGGCGSDGDGKVSEDSQPSPIPTSAIDNHWDGMIWDQGQWG